MDYRELVIEEIPDDDFLLMRVHKNHISPEGLMPIAFREHEGGMSTDWAKYSSAIQTRNRVVNYGKDPLNYGVVNLHVQKVRLLDNQSVIHRPIPENYSHTDIVGEKTTEIRLNFLRIYEWEIAINQQT